VSDKNSPIEVGESFILLDIDGKHVHVIVAESSPGDSGQVMLVYVSSKNIPQKDTTTLINIGDHDFINRPSWVRYQNIKIVQKASLVPNIIQHFGKVSDRLLERIQSGIYKSDMVLRKNKEVFSEWNMTKISRDIFSK